MKLRTQLAKIFTSLKKIMLAFAAVALIALPAFAADAPPHDMKAKKKQMMKQNPEMMKEMMKNPHHALAMAYRMNLVSFGKALKNVAQQGETVPQDFARTAIDEMKRSAELMEKHHTVCLQAMSADMKAKMGDMPQMMDEHMANVKTHLGHLDDLAKNEKIESKDVIKHVDLLFMGCEGMDMGEMK